ncbi:MAG: M23 family metallopeptidase [Bacillota bacterium]|nr:M23 family metallopeptidase [Bacillota bacterium]
MLIILKRKSAILSIAAFIVFASIIVIAAIVPHQSFICTAGEEEGQQEKYIKWVDFSIPYAAMEKAMNLDIKSYGSDHHYYWIEILSYLAAKYYGHYSKYKAKDMDALVQKLKDGQTITSLTTGMKLYSYYYEAYTSVLGGYLGEYEIEVPKKDNPSEKELVKKYGLKVFSPIAKGYSFGHYDDFGDSRSYGYKRVHLGHDLVTGVGTPVVAVETGYVEALGWNQYGGWRIGIRSFDGKRYYYYAHLRKDHPYQKDLAVGDLVKAGDVIGYVGMTGYSTKENVNNIKTPHLHFGIQLIFNEVQKDGTNQIWVDCYNIVKLLQKSRSAVVKNSETKEFTRAYDITLPELD